MSGSSFCGDNGKMRQHRARLACAQLRCDPAERTAVWGEAPGRQRTPWPTRRGWALSWKKFSAPAAPGKRAFLRSSGSPAGPFITQGLITGTQLVAQFQINVHDSGMLGKDTHVSTRGRGPGKQSSNKFGRKQIYCPVVMRANGLPLKQQINLGESK